MTDAEPARIPLLDLRPEIQEQWDELVEAMTGVLRSGTFILGPNVEAFEREAAAFLGCRHAVGVNSGTDALALALRALGVGPGDEVVTSPFTFVATAEAIVQAGAMPVFADIDPLTHNLDPARVEAAVTRRTRAVVPVHLYGRSAPVAELREMAAARNLVVVEDAAQAFGARVDGDGDGRRVGTIGDAGAFSFFPSKALGGFGDGGMVASDDEQVAARVRRLRAHGAGRKHHSTEIGCNSRLDEIQAALLRVRLPRVDALAEMRRDVARRYDAALAGVPGVVIPADGPGAVVCLYTIRVEGGRRPAVAAALSAVGIASAVYYPVPLHRLPPFAGGDNVCPEADRASAEVLSLPLWPSMPPAAVDEVVDTIAAALRSPG